ncbi:MAG: tetratricopeptide repeat protein [Gammaproteobacteria bacterium]|nr:tetratricopeptide repeat protein [Gammaproteobacteria bacterium]
MSLLLEALKKAADAKRQQEEERIYQRTGQRPVISDEMLAELEDPPGVEEALSVEPIEHVAQPTPVDSDDYRPPLSHAEAVAGVSEGSIHSQRVAHSVFESKTPFAGERVRRVVLVFAAAVAVLGLMALGGYTYHQKRDDQLRAQLADVRTLPNRAEEPRGQAPPVQSTPSPAPQTNVETEPPATQETVAIRDPEPRPPAPERSVPEPPAAAAPPVATAPAENVTLEQNRAADAASPASEVNIVRNDTRDEIAAALSAGYNAFQRGDVSRAQVHYARALRLDEQNRDALLGLAAVAVKQGDNQRALQMYRALLRKNPRDSVAAAALSSLPNTGSARTRETELKLLLRSNPRAAELHFALGSMYSNEQRWAEAQAAFFEAHKWDSDNPDFIFNLAVSLDHLNKFAAAEQYYAAALSAANSRAASFDLQAARERIRELREAHSGEG